MSSQQLSEISAGFLTIDSRVKLSKWLNIDDSKLRSILYSKKNAVRYFKFEISKRDGGSRQISAPTPTLKYIQNSLLRVFSEIAPPTSLAKGFVSGRTIIDHAKPHKNKNWIVLVDLEQFFPSINFGRVRGAFRAEPFCFNDEVATVLATICCNDNCLPQGAPTSPVLSNLIARKLDRFILQIAKKSRCDVTRYADDICFSSNTKKPPELLVDIKNSCPSEYLVSAVNECGFKINKSKFRLIYSHDQQMVTGITVNKVLSMPRRWRRQLRVICRLERDKTADQSLKIINQWRRGKLRIKAKELSSVIAGKGGFLCWMDRNNGTRHIDALIRSYPAETINVPRNKWQINIRAMSEGLSDIDHFRSALRWFKEHNEFKEFDLTFANFPGEHGDTQLLQRLKWLKDNSDNKFVIGIFDCDNNNLMKLAGLSPGIFLRMSKTIFSMCLAPPLGLSNQPFCIENLYVREQIIKQTDEGKRLFFSDEFDKSTGLHNSGLYKRAHPQSKSLLVSDPVTRISDGNSVLLSKSDFATLVFNKSPPFNSLNFQGFAPTFKLLRELVEAAIRRFVLESATGDQT